MKIFFSRSKPRLAAPGGRRAYSEAELQAALRDIQSGRLGTRRAAVLYNIPRSTLRNKVYKLAVERQRESTLPGTLASAMDRGKIYVYFVVRGVKGTCENLCTFGVEYVGLVE